ncbi:ion transporter [Hirschia litorea]|uniref:Ion transporter n=1 Tax=Hirschia litorea TaxID=1199156 RepID=A0ABW2ILY0_9PROT
MSSVDLTKDKKLSGARKWAISVVEHKWFAPFITVIIVVNAITLGMGTYDVWPTGWVRAMHAFDGIVTSIFVMEIGLKLIAYRWGFFKSGWNVFDLAIVSIALVPGAGPLSVLRAMRVLRVLRLISIVPMLRRIVEALLRAIPGMGAILAVLGLMIYVASVMATTLYSETNPVLFGSLPASALSLFQVMTMDGWRMEVVQPVMDAGHPYAWMFFLTYIVFVSFAVLNLFMALIVESLNDDFREEVQEMEEVADDLKEGQEEAHLERAELVMLIKSMREEMAELKDAVADNAEALRETKLRQKR